MKKPKPAAAGNATVQITINTPVSERNEQSDIRTVIAVFDDNDAFLTMADRKSAAVKVSLPSAHVGRVVTAFHGYVPEGITKPTSERLRRGRATEQRFLVQQGADLTLLSTESRRWRASYHRVIGTVYLTVTSPDGTVQARPMCNTRVIISEVDASIRVILHRLPTHLLYRLRDEWLGLLRAPDNQGVLSTNDRLVRECQQATAPEQLKIALLAASQLLLSFWTHFEWLSTFYTLDRHQTVTADETGYFEAEVSFPSRGDPPDLYVSVEQSCTPGGWLEVHAPPVHRNTFWGYRSGTHRWRSGTL